MTAAPGLRAGIRGVWSLKDAPDSAHERLLVITFVESTHVLAMSDAEELDEASLPGFALDCLTLFCGPLGGGARAVQVTQREARLIDVAQGDATGTAWAAPPGATLAKVASTGGAEMLVATGQGALFVLSASDGGLSCVAQADIEAEVACVDIASWTDDGAPPASHSAHSPCRAAREAVARLD